MNKAELIITKIAAPQFAGVKDFLTSVIGKASKADEGIARASSRMAQTSREIDTAVARGKTNLSSKYQALLKDKKISNNLKNFKDVEEAKTKAARTYSAIGGGALAVGLGGATMLDKD